MSTIHGNGNNEQNPVYYAIINGKKIALTHEQRKGWNEMINRNRRYARDFGLCGQPDFRKCSGDCGTCPFKKEGAFVYMDDRERFVDGYSKGKFAPANPAVTTEDEAVGAETWDWLYREAEKTVKRGQEILYLSMQEGLSAHQIADRTGIAKSTVVDRLNKLLDFIREHRDDLI